MSHIWAKNDEGVWQDYLLCTELVTLGPDEPSPLSVPEQLGCVSGPVVVKTSESNGLECWTLLCAPQNSIRINGNHIPAGARVLKDRDAIAIGRGRTLFFSTEEVARIVSYPGDEDGTCCIRCKLPLEAGAPVVRCPNSTCGFFHHEADDRPCWTYAAGCAACGYPTDLNAGLRWSPVEL